MYYFTLDHSLCVTLSKSLATALTADIIEEGSTDFEIDFGGVQIESMKSITFPTIDGQYHLLAHHLTQFTAALRAAMVESKGYILLKTFRFTHVMWTATALDILKQITSNWPTYMALERHNIEAWTKGLQALTNCPAVDVTRELTPPPGAQ